MLEKVNQWNPPTKDHYGLKSFMVQQIVDTISCDGDPSFYERSLREITKEIKELTPEQARTTLLKKLNKDVEYYKKEADKESERGNKREDWIKELYKSVGMEI